MDKISGIIPSSARVSAVDMKESMPIRPGTPSFGRPEGVSSLKDPNAPTTAARAAGIQQNMMDWRSKDLNQAAIAKKVSDGFFGRGTQATDPVRDVDSAGAAPMYQMPVSSTPTGFKSPEPSKVFFDDGDEPAPQLKQPEGLFPKGSFIDRTA